MKRKPDAFGAYFRGLKEEDRGLAAAFFRELDRHILLGRNENRTMRKDFENGLLYYAKAGVGLQEALRRLDPRRLGGFYARDAAVWYPLDSAAKVYPLSMEQGKMAVFRLAVNLKEEIVPEMLQLALTFTIGRFPSFATTLKKGFFWHYLDGWKGRYPVQQEKDMPCRPLKIGRTGAVSFRVLWWKNRISVEFFHILTDGNGGMVFLKTLVAEYLRLLGTEVPASEGVLDVTELPEPGETANEFPRVRAEDAAGGFADKGALQLGGRRSTVNPCQVIRLKLDAARLLAAAKERDVTVTAFMLSRILFACRKAMDGTNGDISVQVPVNLRKIYPSKTLRNFALYCGVRFPAGEICHPDALLTGITAQLREKTSPGAMARMARSTQRLVAMARFLPLWLKFPVVQAVYGVLGDRIFTTTLSNLGVVKVPKEMEEKIQDLDFVLGTARVNRALCSLVTFGDVASLSIAKQTMDPTFEEALMAVLEKDGLIFAVEGSERYEV